MFNLTDFTITARNKAQEARNEIVGALKSWEQRIETVVDEEKESFDAQKQHLKNALVKIEYALAFLHHSEGNTSAAAELMRPKMIPEPTPKTQQTGAGAANATAPAE